MAVTSRGRLVTRRRFLSTATSLVAVQALGRRIAKPYLRPRIRRPSITQRLAIGHVGTDSEIVWVRAPTGPRRKSGRNRDVRKLQRRPRCFNRRRSC